MATDTAPHLQGLPPEVREKIWTGVFSDVILRPKISQPAALNGTCPAKFDSRLELHNGHRGLLLTSKSIHAEAAHLLDESMTLQISGEHLLDRVNHPLSAVALSKIQRVFITQPLDLARSALQITADVLNAISVVFHKLRRLEMYLSMVSPDDITAIVQDAEGFRRANEAALERGFAEIGRRLLGLQVRTAFINVVPGLRAAFLVSLPCLF